MELAGAELALAGQALGDARTAGWLSAALHWASAYLAHEAGEDTLNLYDTSALAHADLVAAIRAPAAPGGLEVARRPSSRTCAPSSVAASATPRAIRSRPVPTRPSSTSRRIPSGCWRRRELYRALTHDDQYVDFASQQRGWVLGANAWGVSLMIGAGSRFPDCPQHVVANLAGHLDGTPPMLVGAVVNGPNGAGSVQRRTGRLLRQRPALPGHDGEDRYARFTGHGSRFVDDVRAWQTVEPALDFSAIAAFALALSR